VLGAVEDPNRGWSDLVIAEPQRAFGDASQTHDVVRTLVHYGVPLWVPELGGAYDPTSGSHKLLLGLMGGLLSEAERERTRIRVFSAMTASAKSGRFHGGRAPFGYRLVDGGPHPNPLRRRDGARLHRLEVDPRAAKVVRRIFKECAEGRTVDDIARGLTRDRIRTPSARAPELHSRVRTTWSKASVHGMLLNPAYAGVAVWARYRYDESRLIDPKNPSLGQRKLQKLRPSKEWVWGPLDGSAVPAIIDWATWDAAVAARNSRASHVMYPSPYSQEIRERHARQ
jgi:DNA invertase Pin-like site-specific DNA recombinase